MVIVDLDVFDDCGEDCGELAQLTEEKEDLCWWEMPGNQAEDYFLDETEYDIRDVTYWLNSPTKHPRAYNFLGFEACKQHFQKNQWQHSGNFHVDVMEIMGGEGRTSQVMTRRHFRIGKNFDAVVGVDLTPTRSTK